MKIQENKKGGMKKLALLFAVAIALVFVISGVAFNVVYTDRTSAVFFNETNVTSFGISLISNASGYNNTAGTFTSFVFYNSTSNFWSTTLGLADTYSTRTGLVTNSGINLSDPNLVGYWALDGTNYVDSKAVHNGACYGTSCPVNATGLSSQALEFDGSNDYVNLTSSTGLTPPSTGLTISAWIYPHTTADYEGIVMKRTVGADFSYGLITMANNKLRFAISDGDGAEQYQDTTLTVTLNKWNYIVGTWNGSLIKTYINTIPDAGSDTAIGIRTTAAPVAIGAHLCGDCGAPGGYFAFDGSIDEVLIYNRSITTAEIGKLYQAGLSQHANTNITLQTRTASSYNLSDPGLFSFWSFNNDNASDFYDELGRNNGTLQGSIAIANAGNGTVGNGYYLDGVDDYLNITASSNYFITGQNGSLSFWMNPKKAGAGTTATDSPAIFAKGGLYAGVLFCSSNRINFYRHNSGTGYNFYSSSLNLNQWYNIVVTYNLTDKKIYINGVLDASDTTGLIHTGPSADPFYIGMGFSGAPAGSRFFNGSVDEVRIYNRTLSAAEIADLYNLGATHFSDWSAWSTATTAQDGVAQATSASGKFMQFKANFNTNNTQTSPYLFNHSVSVALDSTAPNATLLTPVNTTIQNNLNPVNFSANLTDDMSGIKNATLYIYNQTDLYNQTNLSVTSGSNSQITSAIVNLVDGIYTWFISLFDISGNSYTTSNNTITVGTICDTGTLSGTCLLNRTYYFNDNEIIGGTGSLTIGSNGSIANYTTNASGTNHGAGVIINFTTINIQSGGNISGGNITIYATNLTIQNNAQIITSGLGYTAGTGIGAGSPGNGYSGGGAGHGSSGGYGYNSGVYSAGGIAYGSSLIPTTFGSGGASAVSTGSVGGSGGGLIKIQTQNLVLNGALISTGLTGTVSGGAGSGGSIYVVTNNLSGNGNVSANGGQGRTSTYFGGGGAGGRIAVWYNTSTFMGINTSSVIGGVKSGDGQAGFSGTLIFIDTDDNIATIKDGFRFQGLTTIANESGALNQTFWNTDYPAYYNFTNLSIINAIVLNGTGNVILNVTNYLSVINSNISMGGTGNSFNISIIDKQFIMNITNSSFTPKLYVDFINTTAGKIHYFGLGSSASNFTPSIGQINIKENNISANEDSNPSLNISAQLTIYNANGTAILRNGIECTELTIPACSNLTAMIVGNNVTFNVSSWSEYSTGEGTPTGLVFNNVSNENSFAISQFIKVNGTNFTLAGQRYTLLGADSYYLADYATNHTYDDDGNEINNSQIYVNEILDKSKSLNINVIRTWGSMVGGNTTVNITDWIQNKSGGHYNLFLNGNVTNYNETMFKGLDYVIYEASKRDIRLQIVLVNNWDTYGGMRWWVQQTTTMGGDGTAAYHDSFYNTTSTMLAFQSYINYTLNRNNTYSGIQYKNDPAIFAWLLANEPRSASSGTNHNLIRNWTINMTAYIKSIDTNHLVGLGIEGFGLVETWGEGTDIIAEQNGTGVDFATFELNPDQWQYIADRSENQTNGAWQTALITTNSTLDWWTTGSGYSYNNRYAGSYIPAWVPALARHGYQNWVSQNVNWSENLLQMPVLLQEVALPTNVSKLTNAQKARFLNNMIYNFYSGGGDGVMMWNLNHDNYYYSTAVDGLMDDGYSFYYSSDPILALKSKGVIDAYAFAMTNNSGGSWVTELNNYQQTFNYNISLNGLGVINSSLWLNVTNQSGQSTNYYFDQLNSTEVIEGVNSFTQSFTTTDESLYWYVQVCTNDSSCTDSDASYVILSNTPIIALTSPAHGIISNQTEFYLNYTVADGLGISKCELYINGALNQTNLTTVTNIANYFFVNVSTTANDYSWQIQCTDTASNIGYSATRTFIYDIGLFNVTLQSPANGVWVNNATQNYTAFINSSAFIATINLYVDSILQDTAVAVGSIYTIVQGLVEILTDGFHIWYYQVIDEFGLIGTSATWNITIDTTYPTISITPLPSIPASGFYNISNPSFSITATDTNLQNVWYSYNGTNTTYGVAFTLTLPDGNYNLTAWANDTVGNTNSTNISFSIDTVKPNGTLILPSNNSYLNYTANINFTANLSDDYSGLSNYTLNIYNQTDLVNQTTVLTPTNPLTLSVDILVNLLDDAYHWFFSLFDLAGNKFDTQNNTLTVDTINPQINFTSITEINNSYKSQTNVYVQVSLTEINFANITYTLYNQTDQINITNYLTNITTINWTGLSQGVYYYNVSVMDLALNRNNTETRKITLDTTNPNATLLTPVNDTKRNVSSNNLTANITDNIGIMNATLNVYNNSGLVNQTTITYSEGTLNALVGFVIDLLDNSVGDIYKWFYQVFDRAGNNFISSNNTIEIDTTKPVITLTTLSPNPAQLSLDTVTLVWSATDMHLDDSYFEILNSSNDIIFARNTTRSVVLPASTFPALGTYTFRITANDTFGNSVTSSSYLGVLATVDTLAPEMNLLSPLNNSEWSSNTVQINLTFRPYDANNLSSAWWNYNDGVNSTLTVSNNQTYSAFVRWDQLDGTTNFYNFTLCVNDTSNNVNCSTSIIKSTVGVTPGLITTGGGGGSTTLPDLLANGTIDTETISKQNYTEPPRPKFIGSILDPVMSFYDWATFALSPKNHELGVFLFWAIFLGSISILFIWSYYSKNYNIKLNWGG